ncbi:MAG: hypothetical protein L3K15_06410 [Thermoplasmata archaeon]|nr:hypothetical protein [Thermoplasmata archaeon]
MTLAIDFAEAGGYMRARRAPSGDGSSLLFTLSDGLTQAGEAVFLWPSWLAPRQTPATKGRIRNQLSPRRRN